MVRIRLEIEKNTLFGRAFVRIRSKIEKNNLFVRALVRVSVKNREKHPLWQGFWIGFGQKYKKTPFLA